MKTKEQLDLVFYNYAWRQNPCILKMDGVEIPSRRILLPIPPSDNARLMVRHGKLMSSVEHRTWSTRAMAMLAKNKLPMFAPEKHTYLHALTIVVLTARNRDCHNYEKSLFDAIEKSQHVYLNDRQIMERHTLGIVDHTAPVEYVICYISKLEDMPQVRDYSVTSDSLKALNDFISKGYGEYAGQKISSQDFPTI